MIINLIFTIAILGIFAYFSISFFNSLKEHKRRIKSMDSWSGIHNKVIEWSNEITDQDTKLQFLLFCADEMMKTSDFNSMIHFEEKRKEFENEILLKFSKHIPSLISDIRDKKLSKLLKYSK
jgi:hypothetical protein